MADPRSKATFYFVDGHTEEHDMRKIGDVWYPAKDRGPMERAERIVLADGTVLKDRLP